MATKLFHALFLLTWLFIFHAGQSCDPSGYLPGTPGNCNTGNGAECCKAGESYPQFTCSPDITGNTPAKMTLNGFGEGEEGGGESKCDGQFHSNKELIVALSTGWYANGSRCQKTIKINANNGNSVFAKVVDECDSVNGCDAEHAFQPPCGNNIVDASRAVWEELKIPESQIGESDITWSDA